MTDEPVQEAPDAEVVASSSEPQATNPDTHDPTRHSEEMTRDDVAPRRTLMAAERTYLAWLRTGLGALGVAIAVGRVAPALLGGSHYAYALLGAGYGVLGIFLVAYALLRARRLDATLATGVSVDLDWWALTITTVISLALAVATIVMVLAEV